MYAILLLILTNIVLMQQIKIYKDNITYDINYEPSLFGTPFKYSISGTAKFVFPLDACDTVTKTSGNFDIAIVERGNCSFIQKIYNVQYANYIAAIVFDNIDENQLLNMYGFGLEITIPSGFISLENSYLIENFDDIIIYGFYVDYADYVIISFSIIFVVILKI